MEKRPERIDYRTQLMRAYFYASRPQQLRELLADTDEYFRQPGKWTEYHIAALAVACVECQLNEAAIEYFDVAIKEHQRTQPNQRIGNGTLSYYYEQLAAAHSGHPSTTGRLLRNRNRKPLPVPAKVKPMPAAGVTTSCW